LLAPGSGSEALDAKTIDRLRTAIDVEFGRNAPPAGFPNLPRVPVQRYTDPDFFALETAKVFDQSWLFVGTMWEFPETGSFKVYDNMGRAEIIIVRGEDGGVRAFYNTCRHRGATVIRDRQGRIDNLVCQFHSWTYDLEGNLIVMPDARDFANDPSFQDCALDSVRCEVWRGFVFINLGHEAPDLKTWLGPLDEDFAWVEGLRPSDRREAVVACNWRATIEAFIEVYHIGTVHPTSVATTLNHRGTVSSFYPHGHSRMVVPHPDWNDPDKVSPENENRHDDAFGFRGEANVSYNIFPNVLVPSGQTGFTLMEFWPLDVNHTKIVTWTVQPDDFPDQDRKTAQDYFDQVLSEDMWNMEHIQHSYQAPNFEGPKMGVHEKRLYYLEQTIDKMIGDEAMPKALRVSPLLDKYVVTTPQDI
jgi:phenylpropionate dioxygenase-like ring-hydroxylating dioxygenase large terminal subunit